MHSLLFVQLLLVISSVYGVISPDETRFICKYAGVKGFSIPCSNASNACDYGTSSGIQCVDLPNSTGLLWNQSIVAVYLNVTFDTNTLDVIPTEIGYLTSLRSFFMYHSSNTSSSTIPTQIGQSKLLTLFTLVCSGGGTLGGTLPSELFTSNVASFFTVRITNCGITGTIPTTLGQTRSLRTLDLSRNNLTGTVPSIYNLSALVTIDVSNNLLYGTLPTIESLTPLEGYVFAKNRFTGDTPTFNTSRLVFLSLSYNQLDGTIAPIIFRGTTYRPLRYLANNNLLMGTIPSELFALSMYSLDFSYNRLSGTIPVEMVNRTELEVLSLSNNQLSGTLSSMVMPSMYLLKLGHNELTGSVPVIEMYANARYSFGRLSPFIQIDMRNNAFTGNVPKLNDFRQITTIDLSNNALSLASDSFGDGGNITWLSLANNALVNLTGNLFSNTTRFRQLITLDLSFCSLRGRLPVNLTAQYIRLNNNFFTGLIDPKINVRIDQTRVPVYIDLSLNRLNNDAARDSSIQTIYTVIDDFPQDVDECALNTSDCEYLCVDGWFPVPGYTCACPPGYELDTVNKRNCTPVCGDDILSYPEEECDYEYSKIGCSRDCHTKEGYVCDSTGCSAICGDGLVMEPEECDNTSPGCDPVTCRTLAGYTCSTQTNLCQSCAQSWQPFIYPPNLALFPSMRKIIGDLDVFDFASCVSCTDGYSLDTRTILGAYQCLNLSTQRSLPCSFACSNLTIFSSAQEGIFTLRNELMKDGFIVKLFRTLFNLNVTLNTTIDSNSPTPYYTTTTVNKSNKRRDYRKRETTTIASLNFNIAPCLTDQSALVSLIRALSRDIVPNLPSPSVSTSLCTVTLSSSEVIQDIILSTSVIVGSALCIIILCIVGLAFHYYRQAELHSLPSDISWSFIDQWTHPWRWSYNGSSKSGYYSRVYETTSDEHKRVESLLTTHFKKGPLVIKQITAVYNRALTVSFVNQWKVMIQRKLHAPEHFFHCTYAKDQEKLAIMKYYNENLLQFTPYNQKLVLPLLPVLHGTDLVVADMIAQTGFASLSSLDPGFYGKGIYFTTSILYTLPYSCGKRRPAVILSYVNMGNIYPVTEDHRSQSSLSGSALKAGYNSHLVITNKEGHVYNEQNGDIVQCDEIVVNQESQILPAFILELDIDSCLREYEKWSREIPLPVNDAALKNHLQMNDSAMATTANTVTQSVISMDTYYEDI